MSGEQAPGRPGDAEVLAAYRKVYGRADRVIVHFAGCRRCAPGYRPPAGDLSCEGYVAAYAADYQEALRAEGGERA